VRPLGEEGRRWPGPDLGAQIAHRHDDWGWRFLAVQLPVHLLNKALESIGPRQNDVDDPVIDGELVFAGQVQERFQFVSQHADRPQVQKTGAAFEGMERSEDGVQRVGVAGVVFQGQNTELNILQVLAGFVDKLPQQFAVSF
jgi:hypothetical protein